MPGTGTTVINFGASPGSTDTSVAVTGQTGILAGSLVEAWVFPANTADHSIDEHLVDPPRVVAANVVAGTGFTIYGFVENQANGPFKNSNPAFVYGIWNVAWVWN